MAFIAVEVQGEKEVLADLRKMEDKVHRKHIQKALMMAAEPLAGTMRRNVAKLTGRTERDIKARPGKDIQGQPSISVGPSKGKRGRHYVGYFLEHGTSKMSARPWFRPAVDAHEGTLAENFVKALGLP